jgi:hypothetical protein
MLRKLLGALIVSVVVLSFASGANAQTVLKNAYLSTSNSISATTGVTHNFSFFHPGANFGSGTFQYCALASGTCTDSGFDVDSAAEGTVTEGGNDRSADWSTSDNTTDTITVTASTADSDANNTWIFGFTGLINPNISTDTNCAASAGGSTRTCYVKINTYSGTNTTGSTGSTTVSVTVTQGVTVTATVDPSFSLIIAGVDPGATATANGTSLTTAITPTVTTIPFGNLTPGTEKFAAQAATVTTNAYGGYSITVRMANNMTGNGYGDDVDAFTGNSANFSTANAWTLPTGTVSGTDTGWLGVGTDDTQVSGQGGANSNEFFSLGTTLTTVATQSTSAQSELDIFVYGIEVNSYQRADSYSGTLRYNALPVY